MGGQTSLATAVNNFTEPCTQLISGPAEIPWMCSYQEEGGEPAHDAACLLSPIVRTECWMLEVAGVLYSVWPISLLMTFHQIGCE